MSDAKRLLGGYATDTLTEAERQELLAAAVDDQELFDSILEEDGLRGLLDTPGARQQVLEVLEQPTGWERFRAWLRRPAVVADLVLLASVLVVGVVAHRVYRGIEPAEISLPAAGRSPVSVPPETLARLYALPPQQVTPAGLEPTGGAAGSPWRVRPGETLKLRATLRGPARMLVIGEGPAGSAVQVFPPLRRAPVLVPPPDSGGPAIRAIEVPASEAPGEHRLRLVVTPIDFPVEGVRPDQVEPLARHLSLVDLTYEVAQP